MSRNCLYEHAVNGVGNCETPHEQRFFEASRLDSRSPINMFRVQKLKDREALVTLQNTLLFIGSHS